MSEKQPWKLFKQCYAIAPLPPPAHTHTTTHIHATINAVYAAHGWSGELLFLLLHWPAEWPPDTPTQKHACMQPSHLASVIPFVWSSKQAANSMNYYNPSKVSGVLQQWEAPLSVCVQCVTSINHYHGRWNSHTLLDTHIHTPPFSLIRVCVSSIFK